MSGDNAQLENISDLIQWNWCQGFRTRCQNLIS